MCDGWLRTIVARPDFPILLEAAPELGRVLRGFARGIGALDLLRGPLKPPPPLSRRKRGPRPKPPPPEPAPAPAPTPYRVLQPGEPVPSNPHLPMLGAGWIPIPQRKPG